MKCECRIKDGATTLCVPCKRKLFGVKNQTAIIATPHQLEMLAVVIQEIAPNMVANNRSITVTWEDNDVTVQYNESTAYESYSALCRRVNQA